MRDNQYTTEGRIRFSEVDHTRRITLPGIVNYFQDCSTFQSEDLGLGIVHCSERKRAWILSSWQVVVERYPEIGEKIQTSTWATDFKGLFGERNFCMTDENWKRCRICQFPVGIHGYRERTSGQDRMNQRLPHMEPESHMR